MAGLLDGLGFTAEARITQVQGAVNKRRSPPKSQTFASLAIVQ